MIAATLLPLSPSLLPVQIGVPGGLELLIVPLIAVLLFGANKLPQLARSSGQAMGEFQRGREEIQRGLAEMQRSANERTTETDLESEVETTRTSSR